MKAILLSIKPEWIAKILNGEKTIEVRKKFPKDYVGWVYLYCSKGKPNLWLPYEYDCFKLDELSQPYLSNKPIIDYDYKMNGKVVARFWCDKIEEIRPKVKLGLLNTYNTYETETLVINPLLEKCCLSYNELDNYLKWKKGFAIHISKLEIFDKPKELSEFKYPHSRLGISRWEIVNGNFVEKRIRKAPQNYCYVEGE